MGGRAYKNVNKRKETTQKRNLSFEGNKNVTEGIKRNKIYYITKYTERDRYSPGHTVSKA